MKYFPMFYKIHPDNKVLVIGGGNVARQKLIVLEKFNFWIHLIAKKVDSSIYKERTTYERLIIEECDFSLDRITNDYSFVVAATSDSILNKKIYEKCVNSRIPVNIVDNAELCTFIFPAVIQENDITIGISTNGTVPVMTQFLKEKILEIIPDDIEQIMDELKSYRIKLRKEIRNHKTRAFLLRRKIIELMEQKSEDKDWNQGK